MKVLYVHLDDGMDERNEMALTEKLTKNRHETLKIRTTHFEFFDQTFNECLESVEKPALVIFARSISSEQIMSVFERWEEVLSAADSPIYTLWIGGDPQKKLLLVNETITSIEEWDATEFLSLYSKVA